MAGTGSASERFHPAISSWNFDCGSTELVRAFREPSEPSGCNASQKVIAREEERMKITRAPIAGLAIVLVAATAVTAGSLLSRDARAVGATATAPTVSELVLFARADGIEVFHTGARKARPVADRGLVIPGTDRIVSARHSNGKTLVTTTQVSRPTTATMRFDRELVASVVSGSGELVALSSPRQPGATPWVPDGRRHSEIVVGSLDGSGSRAYRLDGNFEPEAFSVDDRTLFLIKYMPAEAPTRYAVRRLNLKTGDVRPIARLKLAAPGVMRGTGRMQILSPDRTQLYTLYTKQGPNYSHATSREHDPGMVHAFVHVLDLRDRWAHCIDLPMPFGAGDATASAMALSRDGSRLYVSDPANGAVATIDIGKLRVLRKDATTAAAEDDQTFAATGSDGLFVASGSLITLLDPSTMTQSSSWDLGGEVLGLISSPAGRIYAATGRDLMRLGAGGPAEAWTLPGIDWLITASGTAS